MRFISDSVLAGFTSASAVLISASQLKHLLGMHIPRYPDLPSTLYYVVTHLRSEAPVGSGSNSSGTGGGGGGGGHSNDGGGGGGVQIAALLTGIGGVLVLTACKCSPRRHLPTGIGGVLVLVGIQKFNKRFCKAVTLPEQLILLVLATLISWLAQLPKEQLPVVGVVPPGLPSPSAAVLGRWSLPMLLRLLQPAMVVAVVSFILSMSIVRIFALKFEYTTDPGVELLALGCATLLGASLHASAHHGAISPQVRSCSPSDAPISSAPSFYRTPSPARSLGRPSSLRLAASTARQCTGSSHLSSWPSCSCCSPGPSDRCPRPSSRRSSSWPSRVSLIWPSLASSIGSRLGTSSRGWLRSLARF